MNAELYHLAVKEGRVERREEKTMIKWMNEPDGSECRPE